MKLRIPALLLLSSTAITAFSLAPQASRRHHVASLAFVNTRLALSSDTASSESKPIVTRLPDSAVEVEIPVPGTATKAAYNKVCAELSKNIQIPGFRKGSKIPPAVLEQAMSAKGGRNALKVQAVNELVKQLVEPALKQQNLDPIGQATLKVSAEELAASYKPGEPLVLHVQCDVWPEIEWKKVEGQEKPYLGLKGKYSRKPFDQAKLDKSLKDLKERYATLEPIQDTNYALQMGDACTVNMQGFMAKEDGTKGDPLPNAASGDSVEVILGKGRYMEGLVEGLIGGKVGEVRQVSVSFPEKLRDKTLAGKKAVFDVEIVQAAKRIVPELTDEFAASIRNGLTVESLLAELRKAIDEEDAKDFVPARNKALGLALAEVMEAPVPDTLITNQAREKFAVMMADMRDNGVSDAEIKRQINPENFNKYKDIVKEDIIRDFKVSMATDEIARLEGITVPAYQVEEQMESIRKNAKETQEELDENMIRAKVQTTLERQAVMSWLAERADLQVEYQEETFDEGLLERLAQETMEREQKLAAEAAAAAASEVAAASASVTTQAIVDVEVSPVVETAQAVPAVEIEKAASEVEVEAAVPEVEAAAAPIETESSTKPVEAEAVTPTVEAEAPKTPPAPTEEEIKAKYAKMSLADRAFQALVDAGLVRPTPDPNDTSE